MNSRYENPQIIFEHEFELSEECAKLKEIAFEKLKEERNSGDVGYYDLPRDSLDLVYNAASKLHVVQNKLPKDIKTIVVIGIGGSSLGVKAIDSMLHPAIRKQKEIVYLENSDPVILSYEIQKIKKDESLFFVISKSGGTIETISIFKMVLNNFSMDLDGIDKERIFAITDKGSILSKFADDYNIEQFHMPKNVGGRFSVLSAVGMVPLLAAGYNVQKILDGARNMVEGFFKRKEDHILEKAAFLACNRDDYVINILMSYSNLFDNFSKWYVQLWAESLGKIDANGNSVGLTPIGLTGAVDQHSFLQLVMEGPRNKTMTFLKINNLENPLIIPDISLKHIEKTNFVNGASFNTLIDAQCDATCESVKHSGVPVNSITLQCINEEIAGSLVMYYELLTSSVGAIMNINTYNQPGVELGKIILKKQFTN